MTGGAGLGFRVAFGAAFATPGDSGESEVFAGVFEHVVYALIGVFGGVLGDAGLGGDGADYVGDGVQDAPVVVGMVDQELPEAEAEEGDFLVDAVDGVGAGEVPSGVAAHVGGVQGGLGVMALKAAAFLQFGNPLRVAAYSQVLQLVMLER